MTQKQIDKLREMLPKWKDCIPPIFTPEEKQLNLELDCRDMINSILCYHGQNRIMENIYLNNYIDKLGYDCVLRLCNEQIQDFNKAIVKTNVHTDYEGCSYNSIIWADER